MLDFSSRDLDAGPSAADRQTCCASHGRSGLGSGRSDVGAWGHPWCVDGLENVPESRWSAVVSDVPGSGWL
jgi:hypothetical protein